MVYKKNYLLIKISCIVVILILFLNTFTFANTVGADDGPITLTRIDVMFKAVENNDMIKVLEKNRDKMVDSLTKVQEIGPMLNKLLMMLPRYKALNDKHIVTQSNNDYKNYAYLNKVMLIDEPRLAQLNLELDALLLIDEEVRTEDEKARISELTAEKQEIEVRRDERLALESKLSSYDKSRIITVYEEMELSALERAFRTVKIYSPNVDSDAMYNAFIYTMYVAPESLKANIAIMELNIQLTITATMLQANQLYNNLLDMIDYKNIQMKVFSLKNDEITSLNAKYNKGFASKTSVNKAKNDLLIISLQKDQINRDLNSIRMTLKKMIGMDITSQIELTDDLDVNRMLNPDINYYINDSMTNNLEIKILEESIRDKENESKYLKQYYGDKASKYKAANSELLQKQFELSEKKISIEKDIINRYAEVALLKEDSEIKKKDYDISLTQELRLEKYFSLGLITEDMLNGAKILSFQKENTYNSAVRKFNNTLMMLEDPLYTHNVNYNKGGK